MRLLRAAHALSAVLILTASYAKLELTAQVAQHCHSPARPHQDTIVTGEYRNLQAFSVPRAIIARVECMIRLPAQSFRAISVQEVRPWMLATSVPRAASVLEDQPDPCYVVVTKEGTARKVPIAPWVQCVPKASTARAQKVSLSPAIVHQETLAKQAAKRLTACHATPATTAQAVCGGRRTAGVPLASTARGHGTLR